MTRSWKLWTREYVADRGEGTHVEVTTYEVDIVLPRFCMNELEKLSGCITFLGQNIVNVYRAKCDCKCAGKRRAAQQTSNDE